MTVAKDKLVVEEYRGLWRLFWWIAEDDDLGGMLGDGGPDTDGAVRVEGAVDHVTALDVAPKTKGVGRDSTGFYWETQPAARKALAQINAAIKIAESERPWPEWAKQALEAGWKPPSGWKP